jgi:hypothetical protein
MWLLEGGNYAALASRISGVSSYALVLKLKGVDPDVAESIGHFSTLIRLLCLKLTLLLYVQDWGQGLKEVLSPLAWRIVNYTPVINSCYCAGPGAGSGGGSATPGLANSCRPQLDLHV